MDSTYSDLPGTSSLLVQFVEKHIPEILISLSKDDSASFGLGRST